MRPLLQFTLDLFGAAPAVAQRPSPGRTPGVGPDSAENTARPSVEWSSNAIDTAASGAVPGASLQHLLAPQRFVHPRANRAIALGSTHVSYEFRRGKRRTIGFSIGPDGLAVRAPAWVPLHEVDAALLEKAGWIVRKLGEARERQGRVESARIEWRDGAAIPYLGEPVRDWCWIRATASRRPVRSFTRMRRAGCCLSPCRMAPRRRRSATRCRPG
jgi:hypothetical protein